MSKRDFLKMTLSNSQAFSLMEVLVATVLNGIVILALVSVYLQITQTQQNLLEEKKGFDTALRAGFYLQNLITQAVDTRWAGNVDLNMLSGGGRIREYYWDASMPSVQDVHTLGFFWREAAKPDQTASLFQRTGIFFQPPTIATSGVLFIDTGGQPDLKPDASDLVFDGLISLRISQSTVGPGDPLPSIKIQYVVRIFRSSPGEWVWCTNAMMLTGACSTTALYKDYPVNLNILLRNNRLGFAQYAAPLNPANPPVVERTFDQLYFFSTNFPLGYQLGGM